MKRIDTSKILTGVGYPPSKKGLEFLQDSYKETLAELAKSIVGDDYAANTPYALYGCVRSGAVSPYSYTAGAVFYNGEIYDFPAIASIAIATSDVCTITTTADPTADPTTMTDASSVNIHDVRAIVLSDAPAVTNGATQFNYSSMVRIIETYNDNPMGTVTYSGGTIAPYVERWSYRRSPGWIDLSFIIRFNVTSGTITRVEFNLPKSLVCRAFHDVGTACYFDNGGTLQYAAPRILNGSGQVVIDLTPGVSSTNDGDLRGMLSLKVGL